jgi:hypothetical protein
MPDLVDQLLAVPGLYLGSQVSPHAPGDDVGVARIVVTPLPGGSGVAMDYEVLTTAKGLNHDEHAVLARGTQGLLLMTAHSHAPVATVVHETEPGYFPAAEGDAPFPMAIRLEIPEPGHLIYSWSYGRPGEELKVADVGDVRAVSLSS